MKGTDEQLTYLGIEVQVVDLDIHIVQFVTRKKLQCVVFQLRMVNSHLRPNEKMGFVDLLNVIDCFAETIFNLSDLSRTGIVEKDRFFVTQPDMIVPVNPTEADRSRQIPEILYRQSVNEFESVMNMVISENLAFLPDFPQRSFRIDI